MVRQNSPAIFGDPPYHIGMENSDPPYSKGSGFRDHPHYHERSLTCTIHLIQLSGVAAKILRILMHQPFNEITEDMKNGEIV